MDMERRFAASAVVEGRQLVGLAAPFNSETRIGGFTEVIAPGAFARTLAEGRDILALADHDETRVLGRTKSGTLELREDGEGLAFALSLPDTQAGRDIAALAERGDLGGCSFGFTVPKGGDAWDGDRRELRSVELHEVSIVQAHPAYDGTEVALRNKPRTPQMFILNPRKAWLETV